MIPDEEVRLTKLAHTAGCAAKIGPGSLAGVLESLPKFEDPRLLVSLDTLVDTALRNGALGAKLTGSGLGGVMVALAANEKDAIRISQKLLKNGAKNTWIYSV